MHGGPLVQKDRRFGPLFRPVFELVKLPLSGLEQGGWSNKLLPPDQFDQFKQLVKVNLGSRHSPALGREEGLASPPLRSRPPLCRSQPPRGHDPLCVDHEPLRAVMITLPAVATLLHFMTLSRRSRSFYASVTTPSRRSRPLFGGHDPPPGGRDTPLWRSRHPGGHSFMAVTSDWSVTGP